MDGLVYAELAFYTDNIRHQRVFGRLREIGFMHMGIQPSETREIQELVATEEARVTLSPDTKRVRAQEGNGDLNASEPSAPKS